MVYSKDEKKNLKSYPLQESLLPKERLGCRELEATEHTQRKNRENARERWATPREANGPGGPRYRLKAVICIIQSFAYSKGVDD